ncbi:hypothetical protein [Streptomyces sp. NPDC005374]|uniref:hypothetical protein n=1 Tax=Streptomyces sp. NPDC005374 TaxID=3364713 RepID=UPI00368484F7
MKLDAAVRPGLDGARFFLVDYLPTYTGAIFVLVLIWAGAPGNAPDFSDAWRTIADLGTGEVLAIVLAVTLGTVLGHPLQLALMRVLEGDWPRSVVRVTRHAERWRRARLASRTRLPQGDTEPTEAQIQESGRAGTRLRRSFPPEGLVRPTALGNVLAAMEWEAGEPYGLDAVVAWPRLYPALGSNTRLIVDDRRNTLDGAARLAATMTVTAIVAASLLLPHGGWWTFLALVPLAIARLAYVGAVRAALAYGECVRTAFDLHRFDMLRALHQPLPQDPEAERALNRALSRSWRQGTGLTTPYDHPVTGSEEAS